MNVKKPFLDGEERELNILIFDDGATFEYLDAVRSDALNFFECRSFADLAAYIDDIRDEAIPLPDILALDLFCDDYATFELLGVDEAVDHGRCGVQLLDSILPRYLKDISSIPAIIFSSFPDKVKDIRVAKLTRTRPVHTEICNREDFAEEFKSLIVRSGIRTKRFVEEFLPRDINQLEYSKLCEVLCDAVQLRTEERRCFIEAVDENVTFKEIFTLTKMGNRKVDYLLRINMALDEFVSQEGKRAFLERNCVREGGRSLLEMIIASADDDLLRVALRVESMVGGSVLK
ncbi:MAG: hypothetical protein HWE30_19385 [Methylocystaceae bacterium]|nr:hypothetical protein [Methylocystaceae bacterium]